MNTELNVAGGRKIDRRRLNRRPLRRTAALLSVGFLIGVLIASAVLVGSASAASRVVDVPCQACGAASDPVQFTFMARLAGSRSGSGAVNTVPLVIGDASDPVQYTFAADRIASEARNAEIARLRGLAGPGAGSWAVADESVHLRALAEEASSSGAVNAIPLTIGDASDPVQYTFAAGRIASEARNAEIARLRGLAGPGAGSWAVAGESVHLNALAEAALSASAGGDCPTLISLTRSQMVTAARLTGLAERYLGRQLSVVRVPLLNHARLTEAARLTGLAEQLGAKPSRVSPGLACLAVP